MITVHGYLGVPDVEACELALTADLVVAPERTLEALAIPKPRRLVLGAISKVALALADQDPQRDIRVLASGDPLFFGVVRRLRQAGIDCEVVPGVSSLAALCAAVGVPWDDAVLASAHGRAIEPVLAACRARPKVAVLTAPGAGVAEIAAGLSDVQRWYVVGERLGEAAERVRVLDGASARSVTDVADPHVVLVLAYPPDDPQCLGVSVGFAGGWSPPAGHGDPSILAAAVIGTLLPGLGDLVAVDGPVGQEVARLCARCGAAALTLTELDRCGARPTYVVASGPDAHQTWRHHAPATKATVLVTDTPPPGVPVSNPPQRLDVTTADGERTTAFLTVIAAAEGSRTEGVA